MHKNLQRKLEEMEEEYERFGREMLEPEALNDHRLMKSLSMRRAAMDQLVNDWRTYRALLEEASELREAQYSDDVELAEFAGAELPGVLARADELEGRVQQAFVMTDDLAIGSLMLEIRAGVGGDEAAIWAGDLAQMYTAYSRSRGWTIETMQMSPADAGGFKQIVLRIEGPGAWSELGYEGGTHQVKRVPATEAQGRVHTSTATVAVLPEPEEVEVEIQPDDVKEIMTTAQGPGGQNVNKVATAVHLIHVPTGIEVRMQETKSQSQNREKAWRLLRARLYERQRAELDAVRREQRRSMIGGGNRAEKIRTYRYKENLVVDHRLGGGGDGGFNLASVMAGDLGPVIASLIAHDVQERLAAL